MNENNSQLRKHISTNEDSISRNLVPSNRYIK